MSNFKFEEVLSKGSDIQLDTTLTQSGKAADAKAVGDKFKDYATKTYVDSAVANSGGGGGSTGGGSTSLPPYFLNNANVCEEVTAALEDFIARGTPIVYNHEGDNCTLVAYEDSLSACYFVVPNGKKLLKVDLSSGAEFVVTEMDFCNLDGNHGGGGGGGIIDVLELPTTNINENALYRITTANLYYNKYLNGTTNIVNGLPSTGDAFTTDFQTISVTYYNVADNTLYCYVPSYIGSMAGIPAGWYPASTLTAVLGYSWGGLVTSLTDMVKEDTFYLLVLNPLYFYKNGKWVEVPTEGSALTLKSKRVSSLQEMIEFCVSKSETLFRIMAELRFMFDTGEGNTFDMVSSSIYAYKTYSLGSNYFLNLEMELQTIEYRRFGVSVTASYNGDGNLIEIKTSGIVEKYTYSNVNGSLSATGIEIIKPTSIEISGDITIQYFA